MRNSSRARYSSRLLLCLVGLGTFAWAQPAGQSELRANQIAALNAELSAAVSSSANPDQARLLLSRRTTLLSELIASDPAKALTLGLPQDVLRRLGANPGGALEVHGEWAGTADAVVEDDRRHQHGRTRWYLHTSQGWLELYFADQPPRQPHAGLRVRGMKSANRVAVAGITAEGPAAAPQCSTTGIQNIAVLMVTTPGMPAFPSGFDSSYFNQLFFGPGTGSLTTDSVNSFWQEASYGRASAAGQVFGPFALAQDYDPDHLWDLQAAAINAADSTVDFTQFTRIVLVFPVQDSGQTGWFGALSGLSTVGCSSIQSPSKGALTGSTAWLPVYPYDEAWAYLGLAAHELGHSLGLNHASTEDYGDVPLGALQDPGTLREYGSPYSVMGFFSNQFNGTKPVLGQYSAEHKVVLNWLTTGEYQQVSTFGTFSLAPYESLTGVRALRVLRDQASNAWLWLEYRQPIGDIDSSLAFLSMGSNVFNGALIHYENPALDRLHMYLLHFNPISMGNAFFTAALAAGHTWQDPYSLLSLTVNRADAGGLSVTVGRDPSCATFGLSSAAFPATGGSGTITVTAAPACAWTATTYAPWITFAGAASGQGSGTVSFVVAQNNDTRSRNGKIWVDRQGLAVSQPASAVPLLISPGDGSTGISLAPRLSWSIVSTAITYDVYLGTSPSPPKVTNTWVDNYVPSQLAANTLYYWRIVALGTATPQTSVTGSFTTQTSGSAVPVLVSPADGAEDISLSPALTWTAAAGATGYDVYFGGTSSPPLVIHTTSTSYSPGPLLAGMRYYWQVVANSSGGSNSSATWSFSTQFTMDAADLISPADGATGVSLAPTLRWSAARGAGSYWVFLGTTDQPPLVYDTKNTSYAPGPLAGGTRYYWYLVCMSPAGTFTSLSRTFTTQAAATAPVLLSPVAGAIDVSLTPTLSWNPAAGATSYDVYFGTSSSPPRVTGTAATSYAPATLLPGTLYYWRVEGKIGSASATSATWSFTTQAVTPLAPVLTTPAKGAVGVSLTPALSWTAVSGATSYDVRFGSSSAPPLVKTVTGTSYTASKVASGTTCYWQIVAKNAAGSAASATWSFTTQIAAPVLAAPARSASDVSPTPVLSWNAATGASSYDVYLGTSSSAPPLATNTTKTSYTPAALLPGTVYYWRVAGKNGSDSASSVTSSFSTQAAAPVLAAPSKGVTGVSATPALSWNAAPGANSYDVYLGTSPSAPPLAINTTNTSYAPARLLPGTQYYWRVAGKSGSGSASSSIWSFTTQIAAPVLAAPATRATDVSVTPTLSWAAASGASSYDVYLGTSSSAPPLATNTTKTSYTPATLSPETLYYWRVVSKIGSTLASSSTWSFTTRIVPPPAPVPVAPAKAATGVPVTPTLSWTGASGATGYEVHFGTSSPPPLVTTVTGTSYAVAKVTPGTTCYWQIVAGNKAGTTPSAIWSFTTQMAVPVLVAPAKGLTGVSLAPAVSWTAVSGATSYDVYLGTSASAPPLATNTTKTSYTPPTLMAGTLYCWRVVAKNDSAAVASATWSFTTQVAAPVLTKPANGTTGVSVTPTLSWIAANGATSYEVHFGTSSPPPPVSVVTATSYTAAKMTSGKTCYWQIVARNSAGSAASDIRSFTTQ